MSKLFMAAGLVSCLLTHGASAESVTAPPPIDYFSGAYVGGALGAASSTFNRTMTTILTPTPPLGNVTMASNAQTNASNFAGQINLGYGRRWNQFYIAGELGYQYAAAKINESFTAVDALMGFPVIAMTGLNVTQNNSLNLSARLGCLYSSRGLFYIVLGANYTQVKVNGVSLLLVPFFSINTSVPFTQKANTWGFLGGVGMTAALSTHWLAGLEGDFVHRGKVNLNVPGVFTANYRANLATVVARLSYRFNL